MIGTHIFILFNKFINLLRFFLFPFLSMIGPFFNSWIRERKRFELKNLSDKLSESFNAIGKKADVAFEISSEGELEQIRPLIDWFLAGNYLVELIYSSESVEKKCCRLATENSENLRIYRLPLITFFVINIFGGQFLSKWITAKKLVLCRYDFFPELLLFGARKEVTFMLVSATFKNKEVVLTGKPFLRFFYFSNLYRLFGFLILASDMDYEKFVKLGIPAERMLSFDFRMVQISKRISRVDNVLEQLDVYLKYLSEFSKCSRLIIGSAWKEDINIFDDSRLLRKIIKGQIHVVIAPHKLDQQFISEIEKYFRQVVGKFAFELPVYHLHSETINLEKFVNEIKEKPGIVILTVPGILCEMYTKFGHVFVGGGYGRSVHSLLEPYVSQARIYCGPKVFRSTEYDFIKTNSSGYIHCVESPDEFYQIFSENMKVPIDSDYRNGLIEKLDEKFLDICRMLN